MSNTGTLVYVVDDDVSVREGVASLARSAGLMAKTFASGEDFLAAPRHKVPSCLVLDMNLPGLNRLDLQQELNKSDVQVPIGAGAACNRGGDDEKPPSIMAPHGLHRVTGRNCARNIT